MNPQETGLIRHLVPSWFMMWLFEFDSWTLLKNGNFQVFISMVIPCVLEIRAKRIATKGIFYSRILNGGAEQGKYKFIVSSLKIIYGGLKSHFL